MCEPHTPYRLLLLSTPIAPLGSGGGGGVELTIRNLTLAMKERGHSVDIVAPKGSVSLNTTLHGMPGELQRPVQQQLQAAKAIEVAGSLRVQTTIRRGKEPAFQNTSEPNALVNMCRFALENEDSYDLIVSFAYDLLPVQMTPSFRTPLAHFVSMSSLYEDFDSAISLIGQNHPGRLGCYTHAQAKTFPEPEVFDVLGFGLDLSLYDFCHNPDPYLVWTGRISPEKGLEDAIEAANQSGFPLKILGRIDDHHYYQTLKNSYSRHDIEFTGFLSTTDMQRIVRKAKALVMTPRWIEAFGIVAVEALACGVPVVSYSAGGPGEIVEDGKTGFLVPPNSVRGLVGAIKKAGLLNRSDCYARARECWNLEDWSVRMENWFQKILTTG